MTDNSHTLRSFDASLDGLLQNFKRMGALTSENCTVATKAYISLLPYCYFCLTKRECPVPALLDVCAMLGVSHAASEKLRDRDVQSDHSARPCRMT